MEAPDRSDALAAFARRIRNVSKTLEQAARLGRGILTPELLAELWWVQRQAYALAEAVVDSGRRA
jgi:hypothetical protein